MDALLTIIVPAYNMEKTIADCLNSLIFQTERNHKIVLVNDGSTDCTEKICLEFHEHYKDLITYVYQENQGLGGARNTGMQYVRTPFFCFLDSDDWLNTRYVEKFSQLIEKIDKTPDVVFTLPWVYDSVTKRVSPWMDKDLYDRIFEVCNGTSCKKTNVIEKPELYALEVSACRKIYRTEFLQNIKFEFPKKLKWEDVPGHFELLHNANTCVALPEVGFFYRTNQGRQITSGSGVSRLDMIPIFQELLAVQEKYNFTKRERAYVLRLMLNFSLWSVDATNLQNIKELLEGYHQVYHDFSEADIQQYLNSVSPDKNRDAGFLRYVIGKDYLELADYRTRGEKISDGAKISLKQGNVKKKKNNLIQGRIQCIRDHGWSYTAKRTVKRYLLREQR